jgi:hypothetical protein
MSKIKNISLTTLFQKRCEESKELPSFDRALLSFLNGEVLSDDVSIFFPPALKSLPTKANSNFYLQELLEFSLFNALAFSKKSPQLEKCLDSIQSFKEIKSLQLNSVSLEVIKLLLQKEESNFFTRQWETGAIFLNKENIHNDFQITALKDHSLIATLWFLLGRKRDDTQLLENVEKSLVWLLNVYKPGHHSFLLSEEKFLSWDSSLFIYLFLSLQERYFDCFYLKKLKGELYEELLGSIENRRGFKNLRLLLLIECYAKQNFPLNEKKKPLNLNTTNYLDEELGIYSVKKKFYSLLVSCVGYQSGLASLVFDEDLSVVNMGPHTSPLGKSDNFGIINNMRDLHSFSDFSLTGMNIEEESISAVVKAGVPKERANSPWSLGNEKSLYWLECGFQLKEKALSLSMHPICFKSFKEHYYLFFVKAQTCEANGSSLEHGSLEHKKINSKFLAFKSDKKSFKLSFLEGKQDVEVLSLPGGDNFWSAHFLVAFPFSENQRTLNCEITLT